jgi:pyruvate dehydrogenase E2 component (dihydrolipoamide acetyltransferase)
MPGISADAEEVVFLEWCINPGEKIKNGDSIALVETEKANVDIVSDQDAILWRSLIKAGDNVIVGAPIAILIELDEKVSDEAALMKQLGLVDSKSNSSESESEKIQVAADQSSLEPAPAADKIANDSPLQNGQVDRTFSSPIARKLAKENNISIDNIVGTGPGNRIVRADVERSIANGSRNSTNQEAVKTPLMNSSSGFIDIPHSGIRKAVAKSLSASKREAPHFYLDATCRVDALLKLRKDINDDGSAKVSINDFVVKAVVKSLVDVPEMNVVWMEDCVRKFNSVDIAIAIGSTKGLVTPVIRSAENLSLIQISNQIKDFATRANEGRLKQNEIEGGAFTVTNLGMFGVESFSAILNPPQVGILAVGAIVEQPIVVDGKLEVGNTLKVTLSADHRPVDGVLAAQWLKRFKTLIEIPALILA